MKANLFAMLIMSGLCLQIQAQTTASSTVGTVSTTPQDTAYTVIERGANHRVWQKTTYEKGPKGQLVPHVHKVTELATGLHYKDAQGQWQESKEKIEAYAKGAIARQGQYQVIFANNLNAAGAVDLQTPDGKRLKSSILGLMYHDTFTDQAVMIARVKDARGELMSDNQVIYPNAFDGLKADVRYTYKKGRFEQDVILREQPPTPESYGLNSETTEIEVITEFINPPKPALTEHNGKGNPVSDQNISWGAARIGQGVAFSSDKAATHQGIAVSKRFTNIQGRNFLMEKIMLKNIKSEISTLPLQSSVSHKSEPVMGFGQFVPPPTPLIKTNMEPMKLASVTPSGRGYVMDYVMVDTDGDDFVFQCGMTYFISCTVNFGGNVTFEGGTVIKYNSDPDSIGDLQFWGNVTCATAPYCPAVLTSRNDDSIGESISDSSYPMNYWGALEGPSSGYVAWHDICVRYAHYGIHVAGAELQVSNSRFINCLYPFWVEWSPYNVTNVLVVNADSVFTGQYYYGAAYNVTVNGCTNLTLDWWGDTGNTLALTNCLLVNVQSDGDTMLTTGCTFHDTDNGGNVFQVIGAGSCYLATNSPYRHAGTTNVDPAVLSELNHRTTYPPIVYSGSNFSTALTLGPIVQRDNNGAPDVGYHYDALDYVFGGCDLFTNLTFSAGAAIAYYEGYGSVSSSGQPYGISLNDGAVLLASGTANSPCRIARYDMVQEGYNGNWGNRGWMGGFMINGSGSSPAPELNTRFTKWSMVGYRDNWAYGIVRSTDCEYYGGGFNSYWGPMYYTNCLFWNSGGSFFDQCDAASFTFENCTFYKGCLAMCRFGWQSPSLWVIKNTAFDGTALFADDYYQGDSSCTAFDYNAYNTNNLSWQSYPWPYPPIYGVLESVGIHDLMVGGFNWQSSWLGDYYLPSDSLLIDHGSAAANQLGLYHFTTQTNQVKEANTIVDIGYHYVAVDANGNPMDSNGDGVADYIQDANGDGVVNNGESNWAIGIVTQPASQSVYQNRTATFSVGAAGVNPLCYQWYYNGSILAGATNNPLVISNVQFAQAGNYSVVVTNTYGTRTSSNATLTVLIPPCDPAPAGLIGWWQAEGTPNDVVRGDQGSLYGGVVYTNGMVGQAFSFNGTNGCLMNSTSGSLTNVQNSFSIEFWANPKRGFDLNAEGSGMVLGGQNYAVFPDMGGTVCAGVGLDVGTNGISIVEHASGYMPSSLVYTNRISGWVHVTLVYSNKSPILYVNGNYVKTGRTSTRPYVYPSKNFGGHITYPWCNYGPFAGQLDEISIYNRALSPDEVYNIYAGGISGKCSLPINIINWPASQTYVIGDDVTLSLTATGTQPMSYQWCQNGVPIIGATNATLSIENIQPANAGSYTVVVSNTLAVTTTVPEMLNVNSPAGYIVLSGSLTNFTFHGASTYYINSTIQLYGTTIIEGGAVIKYGKQTNSQLVINGPLNWQTAPYRPVILTSRDDDMPGGRINCSSGTPTNNYNLIYLVESGGQTNDYRGLRVKYAGTAISGASAVNVWDSQFIQCGTAVTNSVGGMIAFHNVLLSGVTNCASTTGAVIGEFMTVDQCQTVSSTATSSINLTNSLLTTVTNANNVNLIASYSLASGTGIYQSMGGGNYYLADNTYRGQGVTNINPLVMADICKKTTWPPQLLTNMITTDTVLVRQIARNPGVPDLGYHYDPLDYFVSCVVTNNSTVTLSNGVALAYIYGGWTGGGGFLLQSCKSFVSQGTATDQNYIVHYSTAQEGPGPVWVNYNNPALLERWAYPINIYHADMSHNPSVTLQFTTMIAAQGSYWLINCSGGNWCLDALTMRNCEIYGGGGWMYLYSCLAYVFENNLFNYACFDLEDTGTVYSHNNLFVGDMTGNQCAYIYNTGSTAGTWTNQNNAYYGCDTYVDGTIGYNAYLDGATIENDLQESDLIVNINWVAGPLGNYYQSTNSDLINAGSTTADQVGLYHYTTQTNQVKEGLTYVDIGFHYVAVDPATGHPYSTYTNGVADYLSDTDGNGLPDWWKMQYFGHIGVDPRADSDGDGWTNLQEYQNGTNPTLVDQPLNVIVTMPGPGTIVP